MQIFFVSRCQLTIWSWKNFYFCGFCGYWQKYTINGGEVKTTVTAFLAPKKKNLTKDEEEELLQGRRNWGCLWRTCTPYFLGKRTKNHAEFCNFPWLLSIVNPLILGVCYDPAISWLKTKTNSFFRLFKFHLFKILYLSTNNLCQGIVRCHEVHGFMEMTRKSTET